MNVVSAKISAPTSWICPSAEMLLTCVDTAPWRQGTNGFIDARNRVGGMDVQMIGWSGCDFTKWVSVACGCCEALVIVLVFRSLQYQRTRVSFCYVQELCLDLRLRRFMCMKPLSLIKGWFGWLQ